VAYDDWRQVIRSVIFHGDNLAWFSILVLHQSRSCVVLSWVVVFSRRSSCGSARPLQCGLVRRLSMAKLELFALSLWVGGIAS
jgi:hypothetical protein